MSAIGPFAIDMYLPALPSIEKDLTADPTTVQMTLLAFFITMGLGQIVVGPIDVKFRCVPDGANLSESA